MDSIGMPTWLRIVLVAGVVVLVTGTGLFAYRWYYRPTPLTISVGSLDGEAGRIMSAIAGRLAATNAGVRLNVMETSSALEAANAFSSGKTDQSKGRRFSLPLKPPALSQRRNALTKA